MPQEEVCCLDYYLTGQNFNKITENNESHKTKEDHFKPLESNFLTYLFRFLKSVSISVPEESISIFSILHIENV